MATILIITLDPPDPSGFKGGLYPQAIRQHSELGLNVIVASLVPDARVEQTDLSSLGAHSLDIESEMSGGYVQVDPSWVTQKLRRERFVQRAKLIAATAKPHSPFCVLGLQSHHTGFAARRISKVLGVPYVCWEHLTGYERGIKFSRSDRHLRQLFSESFVTATVSQSLLTTIRSRFLMELPQGRVVPNPLPEGFSESPQSPTPDWLASFSKGRFLFGAWTTWRDQKRLDVLLKAFEKVDKKYDDVALVVAGRIAQGYCNDIIAKQHVGTTLLTGPISRSDIHHLAHRADCCCISSDYETFGLPMLESLAAGRPVVSTRCAGPDDVLNDPRLGRICERGDVNGLANAMGEVYEKRDIFNRADISRLAIERFGEEAQLGRWRSIYEPLL